MKNFSRYVLIFLNYFRLFSQEYYTVIQQIGSQVFCPLTNGRILCLLFAYKRFLKPITYSNKKTYRIHNSYHGSTTYLGNIKV